MQKTLENGMIKLSDLSTGAGFLFINSMNGFVGTSLNFNIEPEK